MVKLIEVQTPNGVMMDVSTPSKSQELEQASKDEAYFNKVTDCLIRRDFKKLGTVINLHTFLPVLTAAAKEKADVHAQCAALVFRTPPHEITEDQRALCKPLTHYIVRRY